MASARKEIASVRVTLMKEREALTQRAGSKVFTKKKSSNYNGKNISSLEIKTHHMLDCPLSEPCAIEWLDGG